MTHSTTAKQYQCISQGGGFQLSSGPRPQPGADEVIFRPKAVALNPLDWKDRLFGATVQSWPAVLGIDGAGIVDSVGENVKAFHPGDEVLSLCGLGNRAGAFQELVTVPSIYVAKKPLKLSFEEAASLPICYLTALAAVTDGLSVPVPFLVTDKAASRIRSLIVLGGSSSVGAAAIQLLRLALPSATILTTAASNHHAHLTGLGATKCLSRAAQDDPAAIKAATPDGAGVDAILDAVAAAAAQPAVFGALSSEGQRLYSQVFTGVDVEVPEGIHHGLVYGRQMFRTQAGPDVMPALAALIEKGKYRVPLPIEIVGKGFEAIEKGLDRMVSGVSGTKLVVSL